MIGNPFEPPRTVDLDGNADAAKDALVLSEPALEELVAAAPWVRWLARMTSASIAVGLVAAVADLVTIKHPFSRAAILFGVALTTMLSTLFLVVLRRYAAASEQLRAGDREAAGRVIDAQASLFKLLGVVLAVALGLLVVSVGLGYTIGRMGVWR